MNLETRIQVEKAARNLAQVLRRNVRVFDDAGSYHIVPDGEGGTRLGDLIYTAHYMGGLKLL